MTGEGEPRPLLQGVEILGALYAGFEVQIRRGAKETGWTPPPPDDDFLYAFNPEGGPPIREFSRYAPVAPFLEGLEWRVLRLSRTGSEDTQQLTCYFIGWDESGTFGLVEISRHTVPPGGGRNRFETKLAFERVNREIGRQREMGLTKPNAAEMTEFDDAIRSLMADTADKRQIAALKRAAAQERKNRHRRPPSPPSGA